MEKRHYQLDTRVLTVFFFVAMPFVAFGSFVVVGMARGALEDALGQNLAQRAVEAKFYVERYIGDQILQLRVVATDSDVIAAAGRPTAEPGASDERRRELASASPVSVRLRGITQLRPSFRLLQLVDTEGRLIAASGHGGRAFHADSAWFRAVASDPLPAPYVGDVFRPNEESQAIQEIGFPVYDNDGRWLGALVAITDANDLYSVLTPVRLGRTGHAVLLRSEDGTLLASDDASEVLAAKFPGFAQVQAARRERRGYWMVPESRQGVGEEARVVPPRIIGFSGVDQVPSVKWMVVVEQDVSEARAPIEGVTRYLWLHFVGAFGTVILLALYFSFKLESPVIDEMLHLHEEHVPASMRSSVSE